jgi:hypothetical protein
MWSVDLNNRSQTSDCQILSNSTGYRLKMWTALVDDLASRQLLAELIRLIQVSHLPKARKSGAVTEYEKQTSNRQEETRKFPTVNIVSNPVNQK